MKPDKVLVACPGCGHTQPEPRAAYSTVCKKCSRHFLVHESRPSTASGGPGPVASVSKPPARDSKRVTCFQCGTDLEVPVTAQSTMCKRCSAHVDLRDYHITATVSKNFKTKGRMVVEPGGCLLNTEALARDVVLKGKLIGKLEAEHTLELHSTAEVKGSFKAGCLIIPAGQRIRWPTPQALADADISGELAAHIQSTGTITLRATGRLFGDVQAVNLVVESGAVLVGGAKIGGKSSG